jgi:hypothetical protein
MGVLSLGRRIRPVDREPELEYQSLFFAELLAARSSLLVRLLVGLVCLFHRGDYYLLQCSSVEICSVFDAKGRRRLLRR